MSLKTIRLKKKKVFHSSNHYSAINIIRERTEEKGLCERETKNKKK
jgi:hypothetical protein